MGRTPLERIVEDREKLFVVGFPRNAVGDLVEIDAFVDENDESAIPKAMGKERPKLDEIVPAVVVNDLADRKSERVPCLGLSRKLAAEPT